jgi:hypothetical protein
MMQFSYQQSFNKNADQLLKMFCDPNYHQQLQKKLGAMDLKVLEQSDDGTRFRIRMQYVIKADTPLPGFAKKVLGDTSTVTQEERWDRSSKRGEVQIEVKGVPAKISAKTALTDTTGGCTKKFDWEVNVKIPLLGGKIEELVAGDIQRKNPIDAAATRALLESYPA